MSGMTAAAVLALATTFGQPIAPKLLLQQATVESGLDPLAIHDNASGASFHPVTIEAALALASRLEAQGHDFDAGLMQINRRNWTWLGLTARAAFDPGMSLAAAASLYVSISKYNTGSPQRGIDNGYVGRVLAAGRQAAPAEPAGASAAAAAAPSPAPVIDMLHGTETETPAAAPVVNLLAGITPSDAVRTAQR